jgi:CDGSH-type Zn-finger protein
MPEPPEPPGAPGNGPYVFECEAGLKYAYCMCQKSRTFPLCDGTHKTLTCGTTPIKVTLEETRSVAWCACGNSKTKPYCDGSHGDL